ncbi:hypothetical protein DFP72DRAFT_1146731 [Ephemerocybe angulata]|uniref:Uncharacterized protein n=1 Tax=Ephemerocybe angulata TaxID=980116 RepID=A0A8H6HLZ0_9AGAR|nr:hypothetical protein DFP72DRAFT_1146731 [Tulosesus angulatus]
MSDIKHTKESLEGLSRKKLQALAKNLGIRANQKSTEIIKEVLELQNAEESKRGDDESQDEQPEELDRQQRAQQGDALQDEKRSFTPPDAPPSATRRTPQALLATRGRPLQPTTSTRNGEQSEQLVSPCSMALPQSPPYEPTSPRSIDLKPSPQNTQCAQNPLRSPQSPAFSPSSPLAQPASSSNQQEREYSPVLEPAPTRFRPQDVTISTTTESISTFRGRAPTQHSASNVLPNGIIYHGPLHPGAVRNASVRSAPPWKWASNIAARREAARAAQLVEEPPRTPDLAAPATPSPSPKEPKLEPHTPEAGPSNSEREMTPPPYSPCEWLEGHGERQGSEGSGSSMSLSSPAKPQTPNAVSERFERRSSVHHFPDSDPPVSPIGGTRTPSPPVSPGIGDPYSPYGTAQVVDPYGGVDPYYEHEPPTAISSISQRRRPQTPHPRARRSIPETPRTDNSLYKPGPSKEATPQREAVYQLPGSNESWDSIHHGPRPEDDAYRAPGSPLEERASRRSLAGSQRSAHSARTLVEAHAEEEEIDENADGASSESDKENAQPGYTAPNDPTVHRSAVPSSPSSLPDYEDDEETAARVSDAPASAHEIHRFHVGVAGVLAENGRIRQTIHRQHLLLESIQQRIGSTRDGVKKETGWKFEGLHNNENRPLSAEERRLKEQRTRHRTGQENRARAPLAPLQDGQPIAANGNGPRGTKRPRDEEENEATQAAILESFKTKKAREKEPEPVEHGYGGTQEDEDDIYA